MVVDSMHRDELGDLTSSLAGSCVLGRGGNAARILRYDRMSY